MAWTRCEHCGKQFSDLGEVCPFCGRERSRDKRSVKSANDTQAAVGAAADPLAGEVDHVASPSVRAKPNQPYFSPVVVVSVVAALAIAFAGFKLFESLERTRAQRAFSQLIASVSADLAKLAVQSGDVVDGIQKAWQDAIFSDYEKRDFNEAIRDVYLRRAGEIDRIGKLSAQVGEELKRMDPPEGKERDYQRLKEIYLLINRYANMAISPSGSLQTYSQQSNQLAAEVRSAIKELELMR